MRGGCLRVSRDEDVEADVGVRLAQVEVAVYAGEVCAVAGLHVGYGNGERRAAPAVLLKDAGEGVGGERRVMMPVDDKHFVAVAAQLYGGVDVLHLAVFRCQRAVALHDTVEAEGLEVGLVAEVTAVEHLPVAYDALVCPVPDEAAEHTWV